MSRLKGARLTTEDAEAIALRALAFLADDPARLSRFMSLTGMGPAELKAGAGSAELSAAVLEYLLADESLLLQFTANNAINPALMAPAHALLAGLGPGEAW